MTLDDPTKLNTTTDATLPKPVASTAGATGAAASIASATSTPASPLPGATKTPASNGLAAGLKPPATKAPSLNDSVADKVKELTSQDSPLMQQAKTAGLKTANRRGLLNSSMAVGASQDAMVRTALPIASQDAGQAFQKNMQATEQAWQSGEKQLDRDQQTAIVDKQITSTEGLAAAQRELDLKMQDINISAADRQQIRQIQSTEGIAAADRALQDMLSKREIASREKMQDKELGSQQSMQQKEINYQTSQRGLDRALQEQLASWNLKSADRNAAAQFLTNMEDMYRGTYDSIMSNPNLDAATRTAQLASAKNLRDKQLSFVEQMYVIDLKWTDADYAAMATTKPAAPATGTATGGPSMAKPFNATAYLAANPDVAAAVRAGKTTAEAHYNQFGKNEGRKW